MFARILRSIAPFVIAFSVAATATAGSREFVKERQTELTSLATKGNSESEQQLSQLLDNTLAFDQLAERSLGPLWAERSDAEKRDFTTVLAKLVKATYQRNLKRTAKWDVAVTDESPVDGGVLVKTLATHRTNKREAPISIDYALCKVGNTWKVFDIVTEGSSLVKNYQGQFTRIIRKKGFPELLARMEKKAAE